MQPISARIIPTSGRVLNFGETHAQRDRLIIRMMAGYEKLPEPPVLSRTAAPRLHQRVYQVSRSTQVSTFLEFDHLLSLMALEKMVDVKKVVKSMNARHQGADAPHSKLKPHGEDTQILAALSSGDYHSKVTGVTDEKPKEEIASELLSEDEFEQRKDAVNKVYEREKAVFGLVEDLFNLGGSSLEVKKELKIIGLDVDKIAQISAEPEAANPPAESEAAENLMQCIASSDILKAAIESHQAHSSMKELALALENMKVSVKNYESSNIVTSAPPKVQIERASLDRLIAPYARIDQLLAAILQSGGS